MFQGPFFQILLIIFAVLFPVIGFGASSSWQ